MFEMKPVRVEVDLEYDHSKMTSEELGPIIKQKRIELNISQRKLADKLNIDHRKLSAWELGTIKSITDDKVKAELFEILGIKDKATTKIVMNLPDNTNVMEAKTAIQFLNYVLTRGIKADNDIALTEGDEYTVNVKHNMRELLERFLSELDSLNKK